MGGKAEENTLGMWFRKLCSYLWYDYICFAWFLFITATFKEISTLPPIADIEAMEKRTGHVAVITGGPRGLALGLVKRLVQLDYTIIMGVRNVSVSEKRLAKFAESNSELSFNKVQFLEMDLKSLDSMKRFAGNVLAETSRVDLLLCNGAMHLEPFEYTVDGYEGHFQVNYLSHFLLTHLLLDKLKETARLKDAPCQIIFTSTVAYAFGNLNLDELEKPDPNFSIQTDRNLYTPMKFYFASRLYPIMSLLYLQRQLDMENFEVYCSAVHPGLIPTDAWDMTGPLLAYVARSIRSKCRTVENGADTILWPTLSPEYSNQGGLYMESGAPIGISEKARNEDLQAILYKKSLKLAGISGKLK